MFYDKYVELCAKRGMTPSAAAKEIGINKAAVSNWKYRKNGPSDITAQKIADYFGVPASELLDEKEKAPTQQGERILSDDDLKVAYFRGADPTLSDEDMDAMWDDAKNFRDFIIQKRNREKHGN